MLVLLQLHLRARVHFARLCVGVTVTRQRVVGVVIVGVVIVDPVVGAPAVWVVPAVGVVCCDGWGATAVDPVPVKVGPASQLPRGVGRVGGVAGWRWEEGGSLRVAWGGARAE